MPAFTVTAPDGRKFTVNAPEGATAQQALEYAQSQDRRPQSKQALYDAIRRADDAGDAEAVKALGRHLQTLEARQGQSKLANLPGPARSQLPQAPKRTWRQFAKDTLTPVANVAGSFLDGVGLGEFTDEAFALGRKLSGRSFDQGQQAWHDQRKAFTRDHPIAHRTAQGVGIAASLAFPEARIAKGAGMGARIVNSAATAAAYSALSGAGQGDGIQERLGNAATGGTFGAVMGGAAPVVLRAGRGAYRASRNTFAPYVNEKAGKAIARKLSDRRIGSMIEAQGFDPAQVAQDLIDRHERGVPSAIADIVPGAEDHAARWLNRSMGPAQSAVRNAVERRQANEAARVRSHIDATLGTTVDPHLQSANLTRTAQEASGPLYAQAFDQGPAYSERIQQFLDDPITKDGLRRGVEVQRLEALAEGRRFDPNDYAIKDFDAAGDPILSATPNLRTLDTIKRGFDDILEESRDGVTGRLNLDQRGRAINSVRAALLDEIDRINPTYGEARAAYAGPASDRTAFRKGLGGSRNTAADARAEMANLGPSELEQFKLADRTRLADTVNAQPHYSDATAPLRGSDARIGLIREVHGEEAASALQARLEGEEAAHRTYRAVRARSATDDLSPLPEGPGALLTAGTQVLTGHPLQAALTIGRSLDGGVGRMGQMTREETAGRLLDLDPANASQTLADIQRRTVRDAIQNARLDRRAAQAGKIGAVQFVSHSGDEDGLYGPTEY